MPSLVPKDQQFTQFARTANSFGVSESPSPFPSQGTELLADLDGRLIVRIAGPEGFLDLAASSTKVASNALVASFFPNGSNPAPASRANVLQISGFNNGAGLLYVQVFNLIALPVAGTVPLLSFPVPPLGTFSFAYQKPWAFNLAPLIVSSSTADTYTAGAADFWFNCEFAAYSL